MNQNLNNQCAATLSSSEGWFLVHSSGGEGAVVSTEIPIEERKSDGQIDVMLIGDHAILRHGLKCGLQDCDDIKVVGEAATGKELLKSVTMSRPEVVVLDIDLSDATGQTLIGQIKKAAPACRIVVLTAYATVRYALNSFRNGTDGFVFENSSFHELLEAIRTVARGKPYVCAERASDWIGWSKFLKNSALEKLSKRELEVLTRVGKGLSLRTTAAQMGISDKTVSTYQTRLMRKLNLDNKTDLVKFVLKTGLID